MSIILDKIISNIFIGYIELVAKTSEISIDEDFDINILNSSIIGFWHGESYGLNILMRELQNEERNISVVVTIDKRGNYIEAMVNRYGLRALRMPDGRRMKNFLRELKEISKKEKESLCIALDGPLGPLKEPKKIGFKLSNESNKRMVLVKSEFSRKARLNKRWDKYIIPLPFGKINFTLNDIGVVDKENISDFNTFKDKIMHVLE